MYLDFLSQNIKSWTLCLCSDAHLHDSLHVWNNISQILHFVAHRLHISVFATALYISLVTTLDHFSIIAQDFFFSLPLPRTHIFHFISFSKYSSHLALRHLYTAFINNQPNLLRILPVSISVLPVGNNPPPWVQPHIPLIIRLPFIRRLLSHFEQIFFQRKTEKGINNAAQRKTCLQGK